MLWLGVALSLLWLVVSGWQGLSLFVHGGNSAALKYTVCVHDASAEKAACEQQFQKDFAAAVNLRRVLLVASMFGPRSAGWLVAWDMVVLRHRIRADPSYRQPPPPFT